MDNSRKDLALDLILAYGHLFLSIALNIVLFRLILDVHGRSFLGLYALILATINLSGTAVSWLSGPLFRAVGEHLPSRRWYRINACQSLCASLYILYGFFLFAPCILFAAPLGDILAENHLDVTERGELVTSLRLLGILFLFHYPLQADLNFLAAILKFRVANLFRMVQALLLGAFVVLSFALSLGFHGIVLAMLLSTMLTLVLTRVYSWWKLVECRFLPQPDPEARTQILGQLALPFFLTNLAFLFLMQIDGFLFKFFGNLALVATYSLVFKIPESLANLNWRFIETLQPWIVNLLTRRGAGAEALDTYRAFKRGLLGSALLMGVGYILLGPTILALWLGKGVAPEGAAFYVIPGVAIFFLTSLRLDQIVAQAGGRLKTILILQILEIAAKGLGILFLLPALGCLATLVPFLIVEGLFYFFYAAHSERLLGGEGSPDSLT